MNDGQEKIPSRFKSLHARAVEAARNHRRSEQFLVEIISEVDEVNLYYRLGYNSLFRYMVDGLKITEAVAFNLSAVIRKSREVPILKERVMAGKISLSKARKITPIINKENQKLWIEIAQTKTQKEIEREVALADNRLSTSERTRYVESGKGFAEKVQTKRESARIQLEVGLSEELMFQLRRCQDLESQKRKRNISLEQCVGAIVSLYLERNDPLNRARRQKNRGRLERGPIANPSAGSGAKGHRCAYRGVEKPQFAKSGMSKIDAVAPVSDRSTPRRSIPSKVKHQVQLRDQGRCTYQNPGGGRCASRRFLEYHHIKPVAKGGPDTLDNLRLLCSGHHKVVHAR